MPIDLPFTISKIYQELGLIKIVDDALENRTFRYNIRHFTLLTAETLISEFQNSEKVSKLTKEFWTSGGETYQSLLDELKYAYDRGTNFANSIDLFIQQENMSNIVTDIFGVL